MTACTRCGVSAWHPEAAACHFTDCEIRALPARGAGEDLSPLGSSPADVPLFHSTPVIAKEAQDHVS